MAELVTKYQQYAEYKDSGAERLGEIPSSWQIVRLKNVLKIRNGRDYKDVEVDSGGYPVYGSGGIFKRSSSYLYDGKSILFGRKGTVDKPLLVSGRFWTVDTMFYSEVFDNALLEYIYYQALIFPFDLLTTNTALPSMTQEDLLELKLVLPTMKQQTQIANFLDFETAQIDTLIEKQQTLIKLLKEKRQAVISHAVTKGVNPDAPMKGSGVEWLGDVPEHWKQVKLKHVVDYIIDAEHKTAPYFEQGKYLVCRTTNVRDGELRLEGGKYTNKETYLEWIKRGKPETGDILFTREAPAGEACVYDGEAPLCLGQRMVLFKLKKDRVLPRFILHSLYSGLADDFIKQLSQGSTVVHFNMADIRNIPLFEPSLEEQQEIIEYLSKLLNKFDDLTYSAEQAIQLMQERRTALISAAVTGKIDVRGWVVQTL